MSPEAYQALADLVGAFPRIVMVAILLGGVGVMVAMAAAEVVIRYGESGPGESGPAEYSRLDRLDGLPRTSFPSHVITGREVVPSAGVHRHGPAGVETPGGQSDSPAAARPVASAAPSQPAAAGAGTATGHAALLSAGLCPHQVVRRPRA